MSQAIPPATVSVEELVGRVADEFTQRLNRGEQPDADEYARRHPEIAELLREVLPALQLLRVPGPAAPEELTGLLGDFRLLRVIGRGGMGVVYEAEQVSLGRRVALKVLPFAATLDARQLQRFRNEVQAAAGLHHTNIVPVYVVGCDRGVHYYAMQFIAGQSLAEALAGLGHTTEETAPPSAPTPPVAALTTEGPITGPGYVRAVTRLMVQAAEALEHAHQQGIVHRDVKPGNLLLDDAGRLWITDFGLAQCRHGPRLTATGDLVGTLRYASPEQLLAKSGPVDARSDVYALGATMYEALTLRPAYPGRDREELLRQIVGTEPPAPRRLNRAIPVELETVLLKAMAKEPGERYATAQELADDLRCFLEQRPVLARRPSVRLRVTRWARRHRHATAAAVAVVLLAIAALAVGTVIVWEEKEQTRQALTVAQKEQEAARTSAAEAEAQKRRAEANVTKALEGATRILMQLDPKPGAPAPSGAALHRSLEEAGLAFFRQFIDESSPDPAVRLESARACRLMAGVYCARHDVPHMHGMMMRAIAILERLAAERPDDGTVQQALLGNRYLLGLFYTSLGRPNEAHAEYERTADLMKQIMARHGTADAQNRYAWFLVDCPDTRLRHPAEAAALAVAALAQAPTEGKYWNTLGVARYRAGEWSEAVKALKRSMELRGGGDPWDWFFLAMASWRLGDRPNARAWYDKSIAWMKQHPPPGEDLLCYLTEAEAMLQVPKSAAPQFQVPP